MPAYRDAMCGRFVLPEEAAVLACWPQIAPIQDGGWKACFNVAPARTVPVLVREPGGGLALRPARWGLIPAWWRRESPPARTFNARSEDAARKPMWRDSLPARRCLVPAGGWYEWKRPDGAAGLSGRPSPQPYFICRPREPVLAFAGLWARREPAGSDPALSFAILTQPAAPAISFIHPRMPVVVPLDQQAEWLDPRTTAETARTLIARACEDFLARPVSSRVNDARQDSPDLTREVQPPPPEPDLFSRPTAG